MKKILLPTLTALVLALIIAVIPTEADFAIYDDTVRLHIIANSDSEEDQALKLAVRDAVLEKYGKRLAEAQSAAAAATEISLLLDEIESTAKEIIEERGYAYSVKATVGKEVYGTREYEDFTLPAGEYTSLRIIIGNGDGKNWWCVMYPPMCLGASIGGDAAINYTNEEMRLIKGSKYNIKFKLIEIISREFG